MNGVFQHFLDLLFSDISYFSSFNFSLYWQLYSPPNCHNCRQVLFCISRMFCFFISTSVVLSSCVISFLSLILSFLREWFVFLSLQICLYIFDNLRQVILQVASSNCESRFSTSTPLGSSFSYDVMVLFVLACRWAHRQGVCGWVTRWSSLSVLLGCFRSYSRLALLYFLGIDFVGYCTSISDNIFWELTIKSCYV